MNPLFPRTVRAASQVAENLVHFRNHYTHRSLCCSVYFHIYKPLKRSRSYGQKIQSSKQSLEVSERGITKNQSIHLTALNGVIFDSFSKSA